MTVIANSRARLPASRAGFSWLLLLTLLLAVTAFAQTPVPPPPKDAPVLDLTGTMRPEEIAALKSRLLEFEKQKGSQIAVLIVPTTGDESIEQYSLRVADQWKVGRAAPDDGVILLVAKDDREVRIEVGTGLEGALPDVIASRIISQVIAPHFREGDFSGGISAAVTRIIAVIEGEPLPAPQPLPEAHRRVGDIGNALPILLMFVFIGSGILRGMLGRVGGAGATAGIAGVLMWILTSIMALSIGAAVLAFLFALISGSGFGGGGGSGWSNRRRGGGGWGGGFGGGGGVGGGGGGGWSGGGGGFSGGGASGRW